MNVPIRTAIAGLISAFTVAVSGCAIAGPASIRSGRAEYNMAIQQTNNEQHLLNIVRLKYRDTPYHLEVTNVASQLILETSASTDLSLRESVPNTYGINAGVKFTERPTISYQPLRGDKFVKQLLSPVDLDVILLMYHSGWSIDRILRVCVQDLGDLPNAPSASGPTPTDAPRFERFREVTRTLRSLQKEGSLRLGRAGESESVRIVIRQEASDRPDVVRMRELLGLAPGARNFTLSAGAGAAPSTDVNVLTRSLVGAFFYLSQSVDVTDDDERAGRVTVTRNPDGTRFDWDRLNGDLFKVRCTDEPPASAVTAIKYRGKWFSIDDSDLSTKSTFAMLMQLFALQAGELKSTTPVLTLPIS